MHYLKLSSAALLAGFLLASVNMAAASSLYRWKDSEGNPVMSDRPPPTGVQYETISTRSNLVQRVEDRQPTADSTAAEPKQAAQTSQPKSAGKLYEKNPEYCAAAKKNLEVLDRSARIRVSDGEGGMRYLSDEDREAQRQNNLEVIEAHCE